MKKNIVNTKELENRIAELDNRRNQLDNKLTKQIEDAREEVSTKYITKVYYEAKHDALIDKVARFEKVTTDAYNVMNDFTAHKGRVTVLEGEIGKLEKQIDLVDARSENRHDKVMTALDVGLTKIQVQLDNRGGKMFNYSVGIIAALATVLNVVFFLSQHIH